MKEQWPEMDPQRLGGKDESHFIVEMQDRLAELREVLGLVTEIGLLAQYEQHTEPFQGQPLSGHDQNYHIKRTADNFLRTGQMEGLHDLLLQQISKSEALVQQNGMLSKNILQFEGALQELDDIYRESERKNSNEFDLKKLVEKQLKEIMNL
mmetsp:Transcript_9740/g.9488  ORF Transcript_9740/g.9488 Transcript_9740/m.9488 type:complete len:152 (+) Transcript_9740:1686-2141(+)